jgi:hypothetical protein
MRDRSDDGRIDGNASPQNVAAWRLTRQRVYVKPVDADQAVSSVNDQTDSPRRVDAPTPAALSWATSGLSAADAERHFASGQELVGVVH